MKRFTKFILMMTILIVGCLFNVVFAVEEVDISSQLLYPNGIIFDENGQVLIADAGNNNIVKIADNESCVIAGYTLPNNIYDMPEGGYLNNNDALKALFDSPCDIVEWNGGIIVSDTNNHVLRFIKDGQVTTFAGSGQAGDLDGFRTNARFNLPKGLAVDDQENLYVADGGSGAIKKITKTGVVTTVCEGLISPYGLCWYEGALYITDMLAHQILKYEDGIVEVISGHAELDDEEYIGAYVDGTLADAQFNFPQGIDVSQYGIAIADTGNSAIRLIQNNLVSTVVSFNLINDVLIISPADVVFNGNLIYAVDSLSGALFVEEVSKFTFSDAEENSLWFENAMELFDIGVINGVGENKFSPDEKLTRSMMAAMIYRHADYLDYDIEVSNNENFSDVLSDMWYTKPVNWIVEQGIANGYEDDTFGVEDYISCEDALVMLYRYNEIFEVENFEDKDTSSNFTLSQVSSYAQDAVKWALENEIITSLENEDNFYRNFLTRAETVEIFCNYINDML